MKGLFAGSFDPPTLGHLNVIERSAKFCSELVVALAENTSKKPFLSIEVRKKLLEELTQHLPQVKIVAITGLTAEYAQTHDVDCFIRSIRNGQDLDQEMMIASANKELCGLETWFLPADHHLASINSTLVREIALKGGELEAFVPSSVSTAIKQCLSRG